MWGSRRPTLVVAAATILSGCFVQGGEGSDKMDHVESTILNGQVTVCTDASLSENARGMTDWSLAASTSLDDFASVVSPRGSRITESSKGEFGKIPERLNMPFCRDKIPQNAIAYGTSGKPADQMTESERAAYGAWQDSNEDTPKSFATATLYVVDDQVVHINIVRITR